MALRAIADFALTLLGLESAPFMQLVDHPTLLPDLRKRITNTLVHFHPSLFAHHAAAPIARVIAHTLDCAHRLARDAPFQTAIHQRCVPIVSIDLVKLLEAGMGGAVPPMNEVRERVFARTLAGGAMV
ncbi:hypothetical protein BCR44DRAFT_1033758 [Catenaria anguillulae PL171]|uniref:Uncharacterized protein n=1 Tax=Catenaria anguillulae PL171 TaxID=765915 RepID=A0A1Y2HUW3_9FUNG|nr:hypothetical protein BCR44DRAFT_1033758 [Catenaria anguillulae PL171]